MTFFTLPPEAEETFDTWISNLEANHPAFLTCNDPDWLRLLLEQTTQAFPDHQHILLSLSETVVESWTGMIREKIGEPAEIAPSVMLHVLHLEHSLMHATAEGKAMFDEWEEATAKFFPSVKLYGDETLLKSLEEKAPAFLAAFSPVSTIQAPATLPYEDLAQSGQAYQSGEIAAAIRVADVLAGVGALAHADLWYDRCLEAGEDTLRAEALLGKAELSIHRDHAEKAQQQLEEALSLAGSGQQALIGKCNLALGRIRMRQRNSRAAADYLEQARKSLSATDQPQDWGKSTEYLASMQEAIGEAKLGISLFLEVAEHWAALPDHTAEAARAYQHAGAILQNQQEYGQALETFSKALEFSRQTEDELLIESLEDSVENMTGLARKQERKGKKGFFGKLFS